MPTMIIIFALIILFGAVFALTHAYLSLRDDFDKQRAVLQNLISTTKAVFEQSKPTMEGVQK